MARWRWVLIATLLVGGLMVYNESGEEGPKEGLLINCFPPAEVHDLEFKGMTGTRIPFSYSTHRLTLKLANHGDLSFTITGGDVNAGVYPADGTTLKMKPLTLSQAVYDQLYYRPWILVVLAGLGGGVVVGRRKMRALSKQKKDLDTLTTATFVLDGLQQRSLILEQIGGYRVLSLLGKGGMAEVYTAVPIDTLDMAAAVAIKVMNLSLRDDPDTIARFEREVIISQELAHPGIVEVLGCGWHNKRLYLAMELVEGRELRDLLPELKGDWPRVSDILSQLMLAVDYAHSRGVFHRDLKPENIMITEAGRVKVMDFGLARAVDSSTLTQKGAAMGTPKYIAPEAVSASGADDRADQYTLGVIAYEMIVGRLPFEGDEVLYLLYSHAHLPPPAPSSLAELPLAVDNVLLRMLSKDPRDRFRDVEEARVELLGALKTLS